MTNIYEQARIFHEVLAEAERARAKFPNPELLSVALTEEVGELAKALLQEPLENVRAEAIQVMCVAMRIILEGDPTVDDFRVRCGLDPTAGGCP